MREMILIALGTLISEDLACIAAGTLVAQGVLSFPAAVFASMTGIFGGDMLLLLTGRLASSHPAVWRLLRKLTAESRLLAAGDWLTRQGAAAAILSRFTPGLRLPTYLAAGLFRAGLRRFTLFLLLAATLWTPLLVGAAAILGEQLTQTALLGASRSMLAAITMFAAFLAIRHLLPVILSYRYRRLAAGAWGRLTRWEFWPAWAAYLPVIPYLVWLSVKYRSLTLFTLANPAIPGGGFCGESKSEILGQLPPDRVADYIVLHPDQPQFSRLQLARVFVARHGFPLVLKPDTGERGDGVQIVRSGRQLERSLSKMTQSMILQRYAAGLEFGIFYARMPGSPRGVILSITAKQMPSLAGDGVRTVEQLVLDDNRAVCLARAYLKRLDGNRVPAPGERVPLAELGSHCKGAVFLDGAKHYTAALDAAADTAARSFRGFYFGRFDVRTPSEEALRRGEFTVIELNGVAGEPAHIYDPAVSLRQAYSALLGHWRLAYEIGACNRSLGRRPMAFGEFARMICRHLAGRHDRLSCNEEDSWQPIAESFSPEARPLAQQPLPLPAQRPKTR